MRVDRVGEVRAVYDGGDELATRWARDARLHIPAIGLSLEGRDAILALRPRSDEVRRQQTERLVDVIEHGDFVIATYITTDDDTGVELRCVDFFRWDGDEIAEQFVHTPPLDYPAAPA